MNDDADGTAVVRDGRVPLRVREAGREVGQRLGAALETLGQRAGARGARGNGDCA